MAGRPLRRLRAEAINALSDEDACELAAQLLRKLNDTQLLVILMDAQRAHGSPATAMDDVRLRVADLIANNPASARLVVGLHPQSVDHLIRTRVRA